MRKRRQPGPNAFSAWLGTITGSALAAKAVTAAMWCLVACGPLALAATVLGHGGARTASPAPNQATTTDIGPAGFAQLYVTAYLRSGGTDVNTYFPDATAGGPGTSTGSRQVTGTVVTAVTQLSPGYWDVIVAADEPTAPGRDAGIHYFQVPVTAGQTPGSYAATAMPAEIAAPPAAAEPALGYDTTIPVTSGPETAAVTQFLNAYLTGSGNLSRYLAPGTMLTAPSPAPYQAIGPVTVYQQDSRPGSVLAQVVATGPAGQQWPLTYALTLTEAAGQWDIAALGPAPALSTAKSQTAP
jgi:hypothetical protein